MNYKILGSVWYTPPAPGLDAASHAILDLPSWNIGVVAIASGPQKGNWKCYIGFASGRDEKMDEQSIASNGMPISKEVACAHFPHLPKGGFVA